MPGQIENIFHKYLRKLPTDNVENCEELLFGQIVWQMCFAR